MSSSTADCTKAIPGAQEKTCLSCDIPAFCRNNYYRGKLLTERDFTDEQRYGIAKMRLHTLALHGWGVVCGLVASPHPNCADKRLVVSKGLAIDGCGREIRLLADDWVALPPPLPAALPPRTSASPPAHDDDEEHDNHDPGCDQQPEPKDYYLCIQYTECETEFGPAPFDDCSCSTSSQKPNRVCEGYKFELSENKPACWDEATQHGCDPDHCGQFYHQAGECCVDSTCFICLPLAVIHDFVPGQPVKDEQIDNWSPRRQLASTSTLDSVLRCLLDKMPPEQLTRIEDSNWEHDRRMLCREFMEEYVGSEQHRSRGFRIEFSHHVHAHAIDNRSFQAMVVVHPENPSDPQHMFIAPAHVDHDPDETTWASLHIDPLYAHRHLDGRSFDLYLTLKCDVIHDRHDHAVDGNFIGHRFPTGDHVQGGTFESWIRVRPRSQNDAMGSAGRRP